ncbi:MAG: pilus assembly protein [Anaerolineae bacterium]|nr:pilus assembly protein [Anaerolineae bacterium]
MARILKRETGQSIVEIVLLFPILILLLMGLLDFGRLFYAMVALNDAAEEGAIYAAIDPTDLTGIQSRASNATTTLVTISAADVSTTVGTIAVGAPITVTVEFDFEFYTPVAVAFFENNQVRLRAEAVNPIINTH